MLLQDKRVYFKNNILKILEQLIVLSLETVFDTIINSHHCLENVILSLHIWMKMC